MPPRCFLDAERPAVFFYNGIGDHILTMPALRAFARAYKGRLTLICAWSAPQFLFDELRLKRRIKLTRREGALEFDDQAARRALGRCDLFVSLSPWMTPALQRLMASLDGAAKVGLTRGFDILARTTESMHSADHAFTVARAVLGGVKLSDYARPLRLPPRSVEDARIVRRELLKTRRMLAVHGDTKRDKRWRRSRMRDVLRDFLAARPDYGVCIVGQERLGLDIPGAGSRVLECSGLSLATTFALVSQADLFLGIDSCMLHAADLCRVSGVGLFGPTRAREWGFRFGNGTSLQARKMDDIKTVDVLSALLVQESRRQTSHIHRVIDTR